MQEQDILKYIEGKSTEIEQKEVEVWITNSNANTSQFNLLKAKFIASTFDRTSDQATEEAYSIFKQNVNSHSKVRKMYPLLKYVAMVVIFVGLGYFFLMNPNEHDNSSITIPDVEITLQLENGVIRTIAEQANMPIKNSEGLIVGEQSGSTIAYENNHAVNKLSYNTIRIPYGKKFQLKLSDGTQVYLNAGSSLKYPIEFMDGMDREVFLDGEAFFEVHEDKKHPFIVNTNAIDVRVLGTRFNVSAYSDDEFINTVLVEGKVAVYPTKATFDESSATMIAPEFAAIYDKNSQAISVEKVNTNMHTAWMKGKLIFRGTPFKHIRKMLERKYNVTITNDNNVLEQQIYNARFDNETIEQVLKTLNESFKIEYHILNNQIVIH